MSATVKPSIIDHPLMKVGVREVTVKQYFTKCPECGKELVSDTEKRLEYVLQLHIRLSHRKQISP